MSAVIIPALRYRNAPKAIEFLKEAFGFEEHLVVPGEGGTIDHAQLTFGNSMIMLGSERDNEYGKLVESGSNGAIGLYVVVDDVDGHCERARNAGATIEMEPEEQDYGGSLYTCRDLEGLVWSFGSYDPWQ